MSERLKIDSSPVPTAEVAGEAIDPRRDGRMFVISAVIEGFLRDETPRGEGGGVGISVGIVDL